MKSTTERIAECKAKAEKALKWAKNLLWGGSILFVVFISLFIVHWCIGDDAPTSIFKADDSKDIIDYASAFGDFMAGSIVALWSLAGLSFVYASFMGQREELLYAEKAVEETAQKVTEQGETIKAQTLALQAMAGHLLAQTEEFKKHSGQFELQNTHLSTQADYLKTMGEHLDAQVKELKEHSGQFKLQNTHLNTQADYLKTMGEHLDAQVKELKEHSGQFKLQNTHLSTQADYLKTMGEHLDAQVKELKEHRIQLIAQNSHLGEHTELLSAQDKTMSNIVAALNTQNKTNFNKLEQKSILDFETELEKQYQNIFSVYGENFSTISKKNDYFQNLIDSLTQHKKHQFKRQIEYKEISKLVWVDGGVNSFLSTYLSDFLNLLKFIETKEGSNLSECKTKFINKIRKNILIKEQVFFFYLFTLSEKYKEHEFKHYIEKYSFLDKIENEFNKPPNDSEYPFHNEEELKLKKMFALSAFEVDTTVNLFDDTK
jgi:uncharacterized protein YozE (UPF0346 family)